MRLLTPIDRVGTDCFKWDLQEREVSSPEMKEAARAAIPMWIADMDFKAPKEAEEALFNVVQHGAYGYTGRTESFFVAIQKWIRKRHGWNVNREWLDFSPGVLPGISACVTAFTQPGDKIIIQSPVYYPFFNIIRNNGRQLVENKLIRNDVYYTMDFDDFEKKASDPQTKMLILCSPHNPVGRVWEREELERLKEICERNGVIVVSDEIHSDLILGDKKHVPYGMIDSSCESKCVMFYAPSKTFNLAGLHTSVAVIPNPKMHAEYQTEMRKKQIYNSTRFGIEAFKAVYNHGESYLEELLCVLNENYHYVKEYLSENIPEIKVSPLEGTYLLWMDFRECGIQTEKLYEFLLKEAGIMLDYGSWFSAEYGGFARMNLACPMETIQAALEQLREAMISKRDGYEYKKGESK